MREPDQRIYELACSLGLRFTRYSDDLYFSSRDRIAARAIDELVAGARRILAEFGFHLNDKKTWVARPGARRSVLGILVDGEKPRLTRDYKRKVEVHLHGTARYGLDNHAQHRDFAATEDLDEHVTGLLAHARLVDPGWSEPHWVTWQRLRSIAAPAQNASHDPTAVEPTAASQDEREDGGAAAAKASIDALIRGGHQYRRSSNYLEMLRFVRRFHWYAPYNAMLVHLQRPGSRFVATEPRWRNDFRRVIKPGAQPLVILQPGGPFMVVFDVGDTEALPGAPPLPGEVTNPLALTSKVNDDRLRKIWNRTISNAARDGVRVTLSDHGAGAAGRVSWSKVLDVVTRPGPRGKGEDEAFPLQFEIQVNRNLPLIDRYATLVHELAHLYCGHIGSPDKKVWPDRSRGSKPRNEIEAESIAHMVMSRLDPDVQMGDYLLGYAQDSDEMPADIALNLMFSVAGNIIEMGKKRLPTRKTT